MTSITIAPLKMRKCRFYLTKNNKLDGVALTKQSSKLSYIFGNNIIYSCNIEYNGVSV